MSNYLLRDRCSTLDGISVVQVDTEVHPPSVICYCKLFVEVKSTTAYESSLNFHTTSRSSIRVSSPLSLSHSVMKSTELIMPFFHRFSLVVFHPLFLYVALLPLPLDATKYDIAIQKSYETYWFIHLRLIVTFIWNRNNIYYFAKRLLLISYFRNWPVNHEIYTW
jgi:hypothetical protein